MPSTTTFYELSAESIDHKVVPMSTYQGKVVLVVNVASKCGYTTQYTGLEKLYKDFAERGLVILGFPCNQFGGQEPGTEAEIKTFCSVNYPVSFPLFSKIDVNGAKTHPVYQFLKQAHGSLPALEAVKWNFAKVLLNRQGQVVERFQSADKPEDLAAKIEKLLG
jgi:glutathione peroxidase